MKSQFLRNYTCPPANTKEESSCQLLLCMSVLSTEFVCVLGLLTTIKFFICNSYCCIVCPPPILNNFIVYTNSHFIYFFCQITIFESNHCNPPHRVIVVVVVIVDVVVVISLAMRPLLLLAVRCWPGQYHKGRQFC